MTPEHGSKSEENCNLRSAKAGHSSNICLSSPNASVLHKLQTRLARGRLNGRVCKKALHGATESGIMVIKSLLYKFKGIFNEYIRCLDGSETNLSGPTPPLKAA